MMKINIKGILIFIALFFLGFVQAQDTFSIVAVDAETGEIGSAGASCVQDADQFGGVILISAILPGRGAINGQATVCIPHINLTNGIQQMENGLSPQEILDWLYSNDACTFDNEEDRQYGVVDFDEMGMPRSAAFTGINTLSHAGQRTGLNYAIQGNILLGPEILDSMEARFLRANTLPLAERLMAALQGANVPGADARCLNEGVSSKSAFLQVYKSDDEVDAPSLRINVEATAFGVEPIDSVQVLFDEWLLTTPTTDLETSNVLVYPNPVDENIYIEIPFDAETLNVQIFRIDGKLILERKLNNSFTSIPANLIAQKGMVIFQVKDAKGNIKKNGKLFIK